MQRWLNTKIHLIVLIQSSITNNVVFINLAINTNLLASAIDCNHLTKLIIQGLKVDNSFIPYTNSNGDSNTLVSPNAEFNTTIANNTIPMPMPRIDTTSMVYREFPRCITNEKLFTLWHFGDKTLGIKDPLKGMNSQQFQQSADRNNFRKKH